MNVLNHLKKRSNTTCELCSNNDSLSHYLIPPSLNENVDNSVLICKTCKDQIEEKQKMNPNHWRCFNDSMWSEYTAVKIMSWRMLQRLRNEGWPRDLLDMMYLEEEALILSRATGEDEDEEHKVIHRDINGVTLNSGDNVVLVKGL